jgi:hypothetical protein
MIRFLSAERNNDLVIIFIDNSVWAENSCLESRFQAESLGYQDFAA